MVAEQLAREVSSGTTMFAAIESAPHESVSKSLHVDVAMVMQPMAGTASGAEDVKAAAATTEGHHLAGPTPYSSLFHTHLPLLVARRFRHEPGQSLSQLERRTRVPDVGNSRLSGLASFLESLLAVQVERAP